MYDEGVIKFQASWTQSGLDPSLRPGACALIAWREMMVLTQIVGQDQARYGGAGFGNVSCRVSPWTNGRGHRKFLITGTQTGGLRTVGLQDFCLVERYDYRKNTVTARGPSQPSSEAMTHGAVYDLSPSIRFVLHAHSPHIWHLADRLRVPVTDPDVPYGTPEMAGEVDRLAHSSSLLDCQIFSMGGHEDGVITFGKTVEEAGLVLVKYLARAYEKQCSIGV